MADDWNNGIDEAVSRLHEHLDGPNPVRFDARDRAALAFVLVALERTRARVSALVELISVACPLGWAAGQDLEMARAWEIRAEALIRGPAAPGDETQTK